MATRAKTIGLFEVPSVKSLCVKHSLKYRGAKILNSLVREGINLDCLSMSTNSQKKHSLKYLAEVQSSMKLSEIIFNI